MGKQPPPVCYNAGTHTFVSSFYGGLQRRVGAAAATDGPVVGPWFFRFIVGNWFLRRSGLGPRHKVPLATGFSLRSYWPTAMDDRQLASYRAVFNESQALMLATVRKVFELSFEPAVSQ